MNPNDDSPDLEGVPGCVHGTGDEGDLCDNCLAEYLEDPEAWHEFGEHPQGRENWRDLQADMDAYAAERDGMPIVDATDIPW